MVGMHHLPPLVEFPADQQPLADRQLGGGEAVEEHQLGEARGVGHDHPSRLAGGGGLLDAHHLHFQRRNLAGQGGADGRANPAIQIGFGQMVQQVDHPFTAHGAPHQSRDGLADATQAGQGFEKREKGIGFHGLTLLGAACI